MTTDFATSFELVLLLTLYAALFIPLFAWVVAGTGGRPAVRR